MRPPATARRYRSRAVPGTTLVDATGLGRFFAGWAVDVGSGTFPAQTLSAAGQDSIVGYTDAMNSPQHYPHATLAVADGAGHALMHERPELLAVLVADWLHRARPEDK